MKPAPGLGFFAPAEALAVAESLNWEVLLIAALVSFVVFKVIGR